MFNELRAGDIESTTPIDTVIHLLPKEDVISAVLHGYNHVRLPRSQAVVDLARKFGRIYAYVEDRLHVDPQRMKAFFADAAHFTNNFDIDGRNRQAGVAFRSVFDVKLEAL